jgi:hypothetical protein
MGKLADGRRRRITEIATASQIRKIAISRAPSATIAPSEGECSTSSA